MEKLRSENGCPWDREQTIDTLKQYMIEECYEVVDAVESGSVAKHKEELGDLLLQIVFQARLREEDGAFNFSDVVKGIVEKLIRRHPHVFADQTVSGTGEVLKNWEAIKSREKQDSGADEPRSAMDGIPKHLPALHKAHHVQKRAARVGFDWTRLHDVVQKVHEELEEVEAALETGNDAEVNEEIGDLLFAVVNLSRFRGVNAEELLQAAVKKFMTRFKIIEKKARADGGELSDCSFEQMDQYWESAKTNATPAV